MSGPRVAGIDLGTTNSALAWAPDRGAIRVFDIVQAGASGDPTSAGTIPSCIYFPTAPETAAGTAAIPWDPRPARVTGVFAREHGALVPARLVTSAKSWLVNAAVDRTAPILPFAAADDGPRISPVDASATVLRHLRDAWNAESGRADADRLERLPIVLTVPASFDDEARDLTLQATRDARLTDVTLLEEPIAALYAWISTHRRDVVDRLPDGALVLVCDIGGGTTDLSLMRASIEEGEVLFDRIAIGEHLLLGGDNVDLALAALIEQQLTTAAGTKLTLAQRQILRRKAAAAKEQLLGDSPVESVSMTLLGSGRGVIGGGLTTTVTREQVVSILADGFLPLTAPDDLPPRERRSALREMGLPYQPEAAITRHLAAFLTRAGRDTGVPMARPHAVLFNGGFFAASLARDRIVEALTSWFGSAPVVLESEHPEAAVAVGAAFYGRLRQHPDAARRLLIRAGSGRAYYIGIQSDDGGARAMCVLPRGTHEGTTVPLDRTFTVVANQSAAFTLYSSLAGRDAAGDIVDIAAPERDAHRHAPLVTVMRYGKRSRRVPIAVTLEARFTETGHLELWCSAPETGHRWRLAFNLRSAEADVLDQAGGGDAEAGDETTVVISDEQLAQAEALIRDVYAGGQAAPEALTGELERATGFGRQAWPLAAIRRLADVLIEVQPGRTRSAAHEIRWLNLTGFCLRPGFGTSLDAFRLGELRKVYAAGLAFRKDVQAQVEWLVLWQRVAAGFTAGQQRELAQRAGGQVGAGQKKPPRVHPQIEREGWRLLGGLERLDVAQRTRLGDEVVERLRRDARNKAFLWTLGRLGARAPLYGPLSSVVPPATVIRWIDRLLEKPPSAEGIATVVQMAARTGDAARDLDETTIERIDGTLRAAGASDEDRRALHEIIEPNRAEATRVFGESLPEGLRLEARPDPTSG